MSGYGTYVFSSGFKSSERGSATIVLFVKKCPKLNLHLMFLYFLHVLNDCAFGRFLQAHVTQGLDSDQEGMPAHVHLCSGYNLPWYHVLVQGNLMTILRHVSEESLSSELQCRVHSSCTVYTILPIGFAFVRRISVKNVSTLY